MISVLILTKNEVEVLEDALQSVSWCDDVHVFDSFSDDGTQALARRMGATVTERQFDGYASQRNAALTEIPFRHEWIFILDADERPSVELSREMQERVADAPASVAAFRVRRRDFLWGTWLKHAQITPTYLRLVRRGHARYSREVNEHLDIDGAVAEMRAPLEHYPFSKGMSCWVERHNRYSTMEAELLVTGAATALCIPARSFAGKDTAKPACGPEGDLLQGAFPSAIQVGVHDVLAGSPAGRPGRVDLCGPADRLRVPDRGEAAGPAAGTSRAREANRDQGANRDQEANRDLKEGRLIHFRSRL